MSQETKNDPSKPLAWISGVIGSMLVIFGFLERITGSELSAPIIAIVAGLVLTGVLIYAKKLQLVIATIAWLAAALFIFIIYTIIAQPVTITGTIIDSSGVTVIGASLTLTDADGVAHNSVTDENGRFEIRNVPQGKYTILTNNKLLFSGDISSGWQRVLAPEVNAGRIVRSDQVAQSPTATPTNGPTPSETVTPTVAFTQTPRPTSTARPTATSTLTPTPTVPPTEVPVSAILLKEDFKDNQANGFIIRNGDWQIVTDELGNKVYDIKGNGIDWTGAFFGSSQWKDYAVEYRFRVLEYKTGNEDTVLWFRNTNSSKGELSYQLYFQHLSILLTYAQLRGSVQSGDVISTYGSHIVETNTWYKVRIEANQTQIKVFVNDTLLIDTSDTRLQGGNLMLNTDPNTHAQFDDVRVWSLGT